MPAMMALISGMPDPSTSLLTNILKLRLKMLKFIRHRNSYHHEYNDECYVDEVPCVIPHVRILHDYKLYYIGTIRFEHTYNR